MSLPRRRRLVEVARERELLVLEDNPYGLLRYEGEALPTLYSLDAEAVGRGGGARTSSSTSGTFSKILSPGTAPRLGGRAAAGAGEAQPRQTGRRPVLLVGDPAVRRGLLPSAAPSGGPAGGVRRAPARALPQPPRRDARGARRALRRRGRAGPRPQGGLFIWATLDERIDTTDLLALARKTEGVAFVPGRAAYMDGRRGASSMRLNFAGVPEAEIREGVRRIGRAIARAARPARLADRRRAARRPPSAPARGEPAAGWRTSPSCAGRRGAAPARATRRAARRRQRSMSAARAGRRPEGRALAGARGLAALRRPRRRTRCCASATRCCAIDAGAGAGRRAARAASPTRHSSRCTAATARTAPCRSCWRRSGSPTRARARRPACAAPTRCSPST